MADAAKKEKLAAAKKRLKSFRKISKNQPPQSESTTKHMSTITEDGDKPNSHVVPKAIATNGDSKISSTPTFHQNPTHTSTPRASSSSHHGRSTSGDQDGNHSTQSVPAVAAARENTGQHSDRQISGLTERIQQLSVQMNGFSETSALANDNLVPNQSMEQLEVRNQELAHTLQKQLQSNEQLSKQLHDTKQVETELHASLNSEKHGFEEKMKRELGALKEQLQVHIQTIGILVAEKTELHSSLTRCKKVADTRLDKIEELCGRLNASRQRIGDLEKSFTYASSDKKKNDQSIKEYQKDVDRLKMELYMQNKSNEEHVQQNSELQGKLQEKVKECASICDNLIEVRGKLEMSELLVQQLQNGAAPQQNPQTMVQIETLLAEKAHLQGQLDQYKEQFQRVSLEREQIAQQSQEYIQQLQQQSQTLQIQIASLADQRDQLLSKNQESEIIIQQLKSSHEKAEETATEEAKAHKELVEKVGKMAMAVGELKHKYETQVADNSQLSRLVMEREELIMEQELKIEQLSDNQIDKDTLLDSIQSDKTALSRAMAQNKELKHQLAELQGAFVKMSTDNMELLNKNQSEQHLSGELSTRLGQQEQELKEVREQLTESQQVIDELKKYSAVLQEQIHPGSQEEGNIDEKMSELKQQTPLIEAMQKELSSAQDNINALTNQNGELRSQLLQTSNQDINMNTGSEQMELLTASIRQLEMERNQIVTILQDEKQLRYEAQTSLDELQDKLAKTTPATLNGDIINKAQFEAIQHAMKQLEGKYTKTMRDKADLMDRSEQQEHTILQLQGETDTISEYISLYQTQRMLLRQRLEEKDDYISRLAREREDQSDKLIQLQSLLVQVLSERQALQDYYGNASVSTTTANHVPHPGVARRQEEKMTGKLDSTHLEDWPDYTSSDSDTSEVEPIIGGQDKANGDITLYSSPSQSPDKMNHTPHWTPSSPASDPTAQKIMHLLSEIGSSMYMDSNDADNNSVLHCSHCTGPLINL